jgi:hypothetical protein
MTDFGPRESLPNEDDKANAQRQHRRRPARWPWFVSGFLLVFVGMLLFVTKYSFTQSGDALMSHRLWQYYIVEIDRELNSSGALGKTSGSFETAAETMFEHVLISVAGGAVMLGVGWVADKIRIR